MKIISKFRRVDLKERAFRYLFCSKPQRRSCRCIFFPNLTHGRDNFMGKYKSPKLPQEREIKIEQIE